MSGRRKSRRIEERATVIAPAKTPDESSKNRVIDECSSEDCSKFSCQQIKEVLNSIPSEIIPDPTELNPSFGVGGGEVYSVSRTPKQRLMRDVPKLPLKKPEIRLSKDEVEKYEHRPSKTPVESALDKPKCTSPRRLRSGKPRVTEDFHFKPDDYFSVQSEKHKTSDHTLSKLKNNIDQGTLKKLLEKNIHIPKDHKEIIENLSKNLEDSFDEWNHLMEEGFSVLLYGLGSKRSLINNFKIRMIPDEPALIINGFFPSLTLKDILDNIIEELMGLSTSTSQSECFEIIEKTMKMYPDECMYLLIHNIDGVMLRSKKVQETLSRLANIRNIHLLASVDHINAPLIWDNVMRAKFNFYWVDATTFLPYEAETSYESSLLVKQSGALALQSLQSVFASLTTNAKSIYCHLVKFQLEYNKNNYSGMPFQDLYRASRENFWVSSDVALRALLTEFLDHNLIKTKRLSDGVEYLLVPLDDGLLKQFLEKYESNG